MISLSLSPSACVSSARHGARDSCAGASMCEVSNGWTHPLCDENTSQCIDTPGSYMCICKVRVYLNLNLTCCIKDVLASLAYGCARDGGQRSEAELVFSVHTKPSAHCAQTGFEVAGYEANSTNVQLCVLPSTSAPSVALTSTAWFWAVIGGALVVGLVLLAGAGVGLFFLVRRARRQAVRAFIKKHPSAASSAAQSLGMRSPLSPLATRHSPLATRHSPLATRHSQLATRHSPLATTWPLQSSATRLLNDSLPFPVDSRCSHQSAFFLRAAVLYDVNVYAQYCWPHFTFYLCYWLLPLLLLHKSSLLVHLSVIVRNVCNRIC